MSNTRRSACLLCFLLAGMTPSQAADQALIDNARKEGEVVWYTTQIVDQLVRPAKAAFEARYGVTVNYVRMATDDITLRVLNEARAGHIAGDIVDGTTGTVVLQKEGLILKWTPDTKLPQRYVDPQGYWVATNQYVMTPGVNTDLVSKEAAPRTYQDLLDPRWRNKMAWSTFSVFGFVALALHEWGEEKGRAYLKELAKQNVTGVAVSARAVLDQVINGEYPIALEIFNNHAVISAGKGAHVSWLKTEPALAVLSVAAIVQGAPHPNAAKLFLEFLTSPEGQTIVAKAGELPVDPAVAPLDPELRPEDGHFRAIYLMPNEYAEGKPKWNAIYDEIFR